MSSSSSKMQHSLRTSGFTGFLDITTINGNGEVDRLATEGLASIRARPKTPGIAPLPALPREHCSGAFQPSTYLPVPDLVILLEIPSKLPPCSNPGNNLLPFRMEPISC